MGFDPISAGNREFISELRLGWSALLVSASLLAMCVTQRASGQGFRMTALSVPGSTGESTPWGINSSGEVVGTFTPKGTSNTKGFLYSGGKYTILEGPAGTTGWVRAFAINSAKTPVAVGDYLVGNRYHGYFYESGDYTTFDYNDVDSTAIFGINDNGDTAGAFGHTGVATEGFVVIKNGEYKGTHAFYGYGSDSTYPYGINNSGDAVGEFIDAKGLAHGFLRAANGKITVIDYPGAAQTYCYGINTSGVIAGTYITAKGADYGFLYSKGKFKITDFATVNGLNADGAYVGTYFGVDGAAAGYIAVPQAFALSKVEIPAQYSQYWSIVNGINKAGVMVGAYNDASGYTHGMMIESGIVTTIDNPEGQTVLFSINSKKEIVGDVFDSQGNPHGFMYSDGKFTSVPGPSGAVGNDATGINDNGWIAGDYYGTDKKYYGFLLKGTTYKQLDLPHELATYAAGINDAGTIVLVGVDAKDFTESFLYNVSTYESIDVPGAAVNNAASINTAGEIVYRIYDNNGGGHAALKKGTDYYIFDFPGGANSGALGINDSGEIVGFYYSSAKSTVPILFEGTE
jgi:hypothetical protein